MTSTDSQLLGTEWIKTAAVHHGQKGRIDKVGPRGPRMRIIGHPIGGRHSRASSKPEYVRLDWFELGNNWQPLRKGDEVRYLAWQVEVAQAREATEKALIQSLQIESDNIIMANEIALTSTEEVACTSVFHKPANGQVPVDQAYLTRNHRWVCLRCKGLRDKYNNARKVKVEAAKQEEREHLIATTGVPRQLITPKNDYVPPKLDILPVEDLPQWKITIVQPTVIVVRAKDFLDAASQVSDKGEIVKVERL